MPRILLVKTSSLGDLVHNFPAVSDIRQHCPEAQIDWVVEEGFSDIPRLHPAIDQVITVAPRRWRKSLSKRATWNEIGALKQRFSSRRYQFVIDTQGLLKSACIARLAPGLRCGLDWRSSREPLRVFYQRTFSVPWRQHAVERNRMLVALALGYSPAPYIDYGIAAPTPPHLLADWADALREQRYVVLLHATSAPVKLWPERQWMKLGDHFQHAGMTSVLPWGSEAERERSQRLATVIHGALVPPRLTLSQLAGLLARAALVVGVDTGLAHLAAALGKPTIGLYTATDPAATGLYGSPSILNLGGKGRPPSVGEVIAAEKKLLP